MSRSLGLVLAISLVFAAGTALATPLGNNQTIFAVGETDPAGATTLFQTNVFFTSQSFLGILTSSVLTGDTSNPFGGLTFTYEYTILTNSPDGIHPADNSTGISIGSFDIFLTDVSYHLPTNGPTPLTISRSAGGDDIEFSFVNLLSSSFVNPGQTSDLLVVQTDATSWTYGFATILDNQSPASVLTLVPVPEPASAALFAAGGAFLLICFRRKQTVIKK